MLNPSQEWTNNATLKTRKTSLAVTTPAAYGPYLQESRLDIRRNSHIPLAENSNIPELLQQRPFSAHSFPSLSPQNMLQHEQHNELIQQQQHGQQMQPLSSRKLFIGGLGQIDDATLRQYYSQWGQVVDCIVIRDPTTKSSRGFGFVTYTTAEMADIAIANRPHIINGKAVDAKRAVPREKMNPIVKTDGLPEFLSLELAHDCRLQLSNLNWEWHTLDTMRAHFEQFGAVEQLEMVAFPRGYGFLSFETQLAVERCLASGSEQIVNGHPVDIKLATLDSLNSDKNTSNQNVATMTDNTNGFEDDREGISEEKHRPQSSTSSSLFGSDDNFDWKKEVELLNKNSTIHRQEEEKEKLLLINKAKNEEIILKNERINEREKEIKN